MTGTVEDESSLIAGLRNGDERAYTQLVDRPAPLSTILHAQGFAVAVNSYRGATLR